MFLESGPMHGIHIVLPVQVQSPYCEDMAVGYLPTLIA